MNPSFHWLIVLINFHSEGNEKRLELSKAVLTKWSDCRLNCTCDSDSCPKFKRRILCPPGSCHSACKAQKLSSRVADFDETNVECCTIKYGKTPIRGLRAKKRIKDNKIILIYAGEVLSYDEAMARQKHYKDNDFQVNYQCVVDNAKNKGKVSFFIDCSQAGNTAGLANCINNLNNAVLRPVSLLSSSYRSFD